MTKDDRAILLQFLTHTGMYIHPVDVKTISSFIFGYEVGRKNKCHFYELFTETLETKYNMKTQSDGWHGQIKRLSEKLSLPEVVVFKKAAINTLATDKLNKEMQSILKSGVIDLIGKIDKTIDPPINESWRNEWLSLNLINEVWYQSLWNKKQWPIIKAIDQRVMNGDLSDSFIKLKEQFEGLKMIS